MPVRLAPEVPGPSASETISVTSNVTAPTSVAKSTSEALVLLTPPHSHEKRRMRTRLVGLRSGKNVKDDAAAKAPLLQDDVASAAAPKLRHRQNYHRSDAPACFFWRRRNPGGALGYRSLTGLTTSATTRMTVMTMKAIATV